ncbi:MAG: hypothetical protein AB7O66_14205 [Limisphaerales bacterium]
MSLLQSVMDAQTARADLSVAVLEKAQELMKRQGDDLVDLLVESGMPTTAAGLDAYA